MLLRFTLALCAVLALSEAAAECGPDRICGLDPAHRRVALPRQPAPQFSAKAVVGEEIKDVSLADYAGQWTVLLYYPFDFTFVCPTEVIAFSDNAKRFRDINTEVLAISTDSAFTHLAWIRTPRDNGGVGVLDIPVVADVSKSISHSYGVLVEDSNDPLYGAALRGLFIIDPEQKVRMIQINDEAVGRSVNETFRLVQAFQYADSHEGEVCPANWTPGDATIRAQPDESKEYFREVFGDDHA